MLRPLLVGLRAHTHTRVCPDVGTAQSWFYVEMEGVHRGGRWVVMSGVRSQGQGSRKIGGFLISPRSQLHSPSPRK